MDHRILMIIFLLVVASNCKAMIEETEIKVCSGTNERMSVPMNLNQHYRNLRDRYTNCTYVDGNLELTWLDNRNLDLSFLRNIREVTGYILISHVNIPNLILPSLKIIRGRTLFQIRTMEQYFALFVAYTQSRTLELPALREISNGSVRFFDNLNLCHMQTIDWNDIMTESGTFSYDNSSIRERECPKCHKSCTAGCWSEASDNCQKLNKINCSPYCGGKRCFGPSPRECCSRLCSGGCTGPTNNDCLTCRNYNDNGVCKKKCPSMQRHNPITGLVELNPNAKYSYGSTCVRDCPDHLLKDNGACVKICPSGKKAESGSCVTCRGPCPKRCVNSLGIIHSGNIDSFRNCSIIEGSMLISDQSFAGFQEVYRNFSFGPTYAAMDPDRLEIFSTLREVTELVKIDASHSKFTNLSYFRNLEIIHGFKLLENDLSSLHIVNTNLKSLELRSLKHIYSGKIVISSNENLCFADTIDWGKIGSESIITDNADQDECRNEGLYCSDDCTSAGCWGVGSHQCLECKNFEFNDTCIKSCDKQPNIYQMNSTQCGKCHSECKTSCTGPEANNCLECAHLKDETYCVSECPKMKYAQNGICTNCHESCAGCTGPNDKIGQNGCIGCRKAIIDGYMIQKCLKENESCPDGYFTQLTFPYDDGLLSRKFVGKSICLKCHPRCELCIGYGFHQKVCQKCHKYKLGEQCEDECPTGYYADEESRQCFPCHANCRECYGSGADKCTKCRFFKLKDVATCVEKCPEDLIADGDNCVKNCPKNKTANGGECVDCFDSCLTRCSSDGIVSSRNIESFRGCEIIDGSVVIVNETFTGYQSGYGNDFSIQQFIRYKEMHPDRLEVFLNVQEITGYLYIQASHEQFIDLSYFRNLKVIGEGPMTSNQFYSLHIVNTSLKSLELRSLKQIGAGLIEIEGNNHLCFVDTVNWGKIHKSDDQELRKIGRNRQQTNCPADWLKCAAECESSGCWGQTKDQCLN